MNKPRNFQCDATGLPCTEGQCRKGYCKLERDEAWRAVSQAGSEVYDLRKEAEKVARDWFDWAGRQPNEVQLQNAMRHPKVLEEAKRRTAVLSTWLVKNSN